MLIGHNTLFTTILNFLCFCSDSINVTPEFVKGLRGEGVSPEVKLAVQQARIGEVKYLVGHPEQLITTEAQALLQALNTKVFVNFILNQ